MADFDSEMRRREHEFNLRADEMSNTVLSHELKVSVSGAARPLVIKG